MYDSIFKIAIMETSVGNFTFGKTITISVVTGTFIISLWTVLLATICVLVWHTIAVLTLITERDNLS